MLGVMIYLLSEKGSYFSGQPFYSNIKFVISEVIKHFNKLFGRCLIFHTKKYLN